MEQVKEISLIVMILQRNLFSHIKRKYKIILSFLNQKFYSIKCNKNMSFKNFRYKDLIKVKKDRIGKDKTYKLNCKKTMKELAGNQLLILKTLKNIIKF